MNQQTLTQPLPLSCNPVTKHEQLKSSPATVCRYPTTRLLNHLSTAQRDERFLVGLHSGISWDGECHRSTTASTATKWFDWRRSSIAGLQRELCSSHFPPWENPVESCRLITSVWSQVEGRMELHLID